MNKLLGQLPWWVATPLLAIFVMGILHQMFKTFGWLEMASGWATIIAAVAALCVAGGWRLAKPKIDEWRFRRLWGRYS